jgi:hypothetical protein
MAVGTGVPVKIYELAIPILLNSLDTLIQQAEDVLANIIRKQIELNIPNVDACNDLELQNLIDRINKIKQSLDNFLNLLNRITGIAGILQTIGATAKAISIYLTISGTPIAPAGLVKALNIISALAVNAVSVAKLISSLLSQVSIQLDVVSVGLNKAINVANSLCPNRQTSLVSIPSIIVNEVDTGFVDNSVTGTSVTSTSTGTGVTSNISTGTGVASDSVFYRDVNVSDPDLDKRLDIVQDLVSKQLDTITGIKEAPSKVVSGNQNPTDTDGNVGDYFINLSTGDIFGPKNVNGTWN